MPVYQYSMIDTRTNLTTEGRIEAPNRRAAKEMLREDGGIPIDLREDADSLKLDQVFQQIPVIGGLFQVKVGLKELNIFTQQLYTLLNAGLPLIEALFLLEQQTSNSRLRQIVKEVRNEVIAGDSLSGALSKYPREFNTLYVNMIRAGETSGEMDGICYRLGQLLDKYIMLQNKIFGALTYPAFTVLVIVGVVIVILTVVVPQFQGLFSNYGAELPLPTQVLVMFSNFIQSFWWAIGLAVGTFGMWFEIYRRGSGKPLVDQWMLTLPLVGDVVRKVYVSRFVRTLATVFAAGISITEGIATASNTVDNYVMRLSFEKARDSILVGGSMAKPLEQTGAFPLMVTKMIAIGEETGNLEAMMQKSADFLDLEVDAAVETMTKMIEPIMIVVLGGIILAVALSLYLPLFDMHKVVH
jgi:type IV pilus assembly protein PilC